MAYDQSSVGMNSSKVRESPYSLPLKMEESILSHIQLHSEFSKLSFVIQMFPKRNLS